MVGFTETRTKLDGLPRSTLTINFVGRSSLIAFLYSFRSSILWRVTNFWVMAFEFPPNYRESPLPQRDVEPSVSVSTA